MLWDLVVVGAGPAGAVAALSACRERPGARVLLLDKAAFPRDKACGDGIAPEVGDVLAGLDAGAVLDGTPEIRWLRVTTPGDRVVRRVPARPCRVVPRTTFDARLVRTATSAGAVLQRARVRQVVPGRTSVALHTDAGVVRARTIVGADGAGSSVRRALGLAANPPGHLAVAVRGYAPDSGPSEQRITLAAPDWPSYAWWFPTGRGVANVGFGLLRSRLRGGRAQLWRGLAALLPDARPDSASLRAAHLPLSSWRPSPTVGRVLLAGDAASLINPLTGEGIYYAVVSGRLAGAAAVTAADPAVTYRRALRAALGPSLRLTTLVAAALRRPGLVEGAVAAAGADHRVFDDLVAMGLADGTLAPRTAAKVAAAWLSRAVRVGQDAV